MRHAFLCAMFLAAATSSIHATAAPATLGKPAPEAALVQAHASLQAVQQLSTRKTFRELGFRSPEEAAKATLGAPLRDFMVRLDKLREYKPGADPKDLLEDRNAVRYPVMVGGEVRTGVVVRQVDGTWTIDSAGRPALTRALMAVAAMDSRSAGSADSRFSVSIPALGLYFVGALEGSGMSLRAVLDDPRFGFKKGEAMAASEVFAKLVPFAQQLQTGPRIAD